MSTFPGPGVGSVGLSWGHCHAKAAVAGLPRHQGPRIVLVAFGCLPRHVD